MHRLRRHTDGRSDGTNIVVVDGVGHDDTARGRRQQRRGQTAGPDRVQWHGIALGGRTSRPRSPPARRWRSGTPGRRRTRFRGPAHRVRRPARSAPRRASCGRRPGKQARTPSRRHLSRKTSVSANTWPRSVESPRSTNLHRLAETAAGFLARRRESGGRGSPRPPRRGLGCWSARRRCRRRRSASVEQLGVDSRGAR